MALTMTTVTGPVLLPNGATPLGGRVSFELSSWDVEDTAGLVVTGPVYVPIDENGQFTVDLFTTTAGTESVTYRMFVIWEDSNLAQSYVNDIYVSNPTPHYTKKFIGSFVLSGLGPYQLSELNIVSEVNNSSFDAYLEMKAFVDRIDLGVLDQAVNDVQVDRDQVEIWKQETAVSAQAAIDAETAAETAAQNANDVVSMIALTATSVGLIPDVLNTTTQVPQGVTVDLLGEAYPVSEVPTHFIARNGSWVVNGVRVNAMGDISKPFNMVSLTSTPLDYTFWNAGMVGDFLGTQSSRGLWRFEVVTKVHDTQGTGTLEKGSRLDMIYYNDAGLTEDYRVTVFSDVDNPRIRAASFGRMDSTRVGGIVVTGAETRKHWFVWCDNLPFGSLNPSNMVWNRVELTFPSGVSHFPHGRMYKGPSGASGDWFVGTYAGTASAKRLRTLDNGITWFEETLLGTDGLPSGSPAEQAHVFIPGRGWMMFTRVDGSESKMWAARSVDGITYDGWYDTGLVLGSNPLDVVYSGGKLHIALAFRSRFASSIQKTDSLEVYEVPAQAVFDTPSIVGEFAPVNVIDLPYTGIGYIDLIKIPQNDQDSVGRYVGFLKAEENKSTVRQTGSTLVRFASVPTPVTNGRHTTMKQIISNSSFKFSRRGDNWSVSGTTNPLVAFDRFEIMPGISSNTITASWSDAPESVRGIFPWAAGEVSLSSDTNATNCGLRQRFLGPDAQEFAKLIDDSEGIVSRVYGYGAPPPKLDVQIRMNGIEVPMGGGVYFPRVPSYITGPWICTLNDSLSSFRGIPISSPTLTSLSQVTSGEIRLGTGAVSGIWPLSCKLLGFEVFVGHGRPGWGEVGLFDEPDDRYLKVFEAPTTDMRLFNATAITRGATVVRAPLLGIVEMMPNPSITVNIQDKLVFEGPDVDYVATSSPTFLTSNSFVPLAPTISFAASGVTGGMSGFIKLLSGGKIMIETGA